MENPTVKKKGKVAALILMILFQFLGFLGLLAWGVFAVLSLGFHDNEGIPELAFIQFIAVIISFISWILFTRGRYVIAVLMSFLPIITAVILLLFFLSTLHYN
jgi:hypothetical protein